MNNAFRFDRTLSGVEENKYNFSYWNTVTNLYDQKQYRESVIALIKYIDESLLTKCGNADQTEFNFPHGSTIVNLKIGKTLEITTPFINLPSTTSVPLMRQVAQLNFWPISISNAVLSNNQIHFRFSCPIELAEPFKIFYTMKEMCQEADNNDDRFIEMFKASYIQEPKIQRYPEVHLEATWNQVQFYVDQCLSCLSFFESKRWGYYWDILACSLMQIDYFASPQGFVHAELDKAIYDLHDNQADVNQRIQYTKAFMEKLKKYDKKKFLDSIYKAETFIPFRSGASIDNVRQQLDYANNTSLDEMKNKYFIGAYFSMYYGMLRILYYNRMDIPVSNYIETAMVSASGRSWEESAGVLRSAYDALMNPALYDSQIVKK
ncbi:hypothetical protein WSM22_47670 [Cytophagales bacterium WSM2-2]|nr:hypothetical protein WSM22_47670 [Cytophagales bacterium WSM2-2]